MATVVVINKGSSEYNDLLRIPEKGEVPESTLKRVRIRLRRGANNVDAELWKIASKRQSFAHLIKNDVLMVMSPGKDISGKDINIRERTREDNTVMCESALQKGAGILGEKELAQNSAGMSVIEVE